MPDRRFVFSLFVIAVLACCEMYATNASADTGCSELLTVEWLVDASETIVVVDYGANGAEGNKSPTIVSVLKGNAKQVTWPLKGDGVKDRMQGAINGPPSDGRRRLAFIGANSTRLQEVRLNRAEGTGHWAGEVAESLSLFDIWYGINQFGELLITEHSFIRAVKQRVKQKPGTKIEKPEHADRHFDHTYSLGDFPLDSVNLICHLVVPMTVEDVAARKKRGQWTSVGD